MKSTLLYALFYLGMAVWAFLDLRKYRSTFLVLLAWFGAAGFLGEIIYYWLVAINVAQNILSFTKSLLSVFAAVTAIIVIWLAIRRSSNRE